MLSQPCRHWLRFYITSGWEAEDKGSNEMDIKREALPRQGLSFVLVASLALLNDVAVNLFHFGGNGFVAILNDGRHELKTGVVEAHDFFVGQL